MRPKQKGGITMLCQFTVKNYKSLRDENTLDMQAASISEHTDKIIHTADGHDFLPVASLYGPNGGGKTNVLEAIEALRLKVINPITVTNTGATKGYSPANLLYPKPYMFSEECKNAPTEFEIFFRAEYAEYRYILHVQDKKVRYESLDRIKFETNRKSALFERDDNGIRLKGAFAKLKISEGLSDTLPLLSYLGITYMDNPIVKDVTEWFMYKLFFLDYGNPLDELILDVNPTEPMKGFFMAMLREMDIDIEDYRVEKQKGHTTEVYTIHEVDGYREELNLKDESQGTRKLFRLLPFIVRCLVRGTTLVVDELDSKIHPVLLGYIITLFTDMRINKNGAQLIFTSHDLSTMNSETFRRDEIWFVAKGNEQNSMLYSMVDFKMPNGEIVRKDSRFDKQYLEGRYGADPYLRKIIDWSELDG